MSRCHNSLRTACIEYTMWVGGRREESGKREFFYLVVGKVTLEGRGPVRKRGRAITASVAIGLSCVITRGSIVVVGNREMRLFRDLLSRTCATCNATSPTSPIQSSTSDV